MQIILESGVRARVVCFLALALIAANMDTVALARTAAYFTSTSSGPVGNMSTVRLDVSVAPTVSGLFNVAANLVPADFQLKTIDVVNNGTGGIPQQDFTYSMTSSSTGAGNTCSLLDSSDPPTCSSPAAPSAAATTGAALVILRCTSDAAATIPLVCATQNVYVTQVYPTLGAGTQKQITAAGGLARTVFTGVGTAASYAIGISGTNFTGGPLVVASAFGMGGPDPVAGVDGQTKGLAASRTDRLASVMYLPSQGGDGLVNQTSVLTYSWTASQRVGGTR
jgi:hypothetical protein